MVKRPRTSSSSERIREVAAHQTPRLLAHHHVDAADDDDDDDDGDDHHRPALFPDPPFSHHRQSSHHAPAAADMHVSPPGSPRGQQRPSTSRSPTGYHTRTSSASSSAGRGGPGTTYFDSHHDGHGLPYDRPMSSSSTMVADSRPSMPSVSSLTGAMSTLQYDSPTPSHRLVHAQRPHPYRPPELASSPSSPSPRPPSMPLSPSTTAPIPNAFALYQPAAPPAASINSSLRRGGGERQKSTGHQLAWDRVHSPPSYPPSGDARSPPAHIPSLFSRPTPLPRLPPSVFADHYYRDSSPSAASASLSSTGHSFSSASASSQLSNNAFATSLSSAPYSSAPSSPHSDSQPRKTHPPLSPAGSGSKTVTVRFDGPTVPAQPLSPESESAKSVANSSAISVGLGLSVINEGDAASNPSIGTRSCVPPPPPPPPPRPPPPPPYSLDAYRHAHGHGQNKNNKSSDKVVSPVFEANPRYGLHDFEFLETLGTGTFGRVLLVRLKSVHPSKPEAYFAMKVLEKTEVVRLKQVEHINSERAILSTVHHPFIVNLFCTFQDSRNCYMLMEYVMGGEIFSHLRRAGRFTPDVTRFYISTIVLAIEYLHQRNIIYRDLKPENLLLDFNGYTKITDFGFAKRVDGRTWTLCGTPEYLAPEIIQSKGHGKAADWWALGVLLFECLAGYPPFFDNNAFGIYEKILAGRIHFPAHVAEPTAKDLVRRLLTADRTKRLGNLKGGAADVKAHPWFRGVDWDALQTGAIRAPIIPRYTRPGDTSNFFKYPPAAADSMPGLDPVRDATLPDPFRHMFEDF